jgi:MoaA/NifB/PqqE/SkfB family radical SAM enzyme
MTAGSDGPWRITFDTNPDDCNLRCVMCEDHSKYSRTQEIRRNLHLPPRRMDVALIRRVVAQAASHGLKEIIPSTMGEPLLYSDFDEILRLCSEFGVQLNLTTNGTFPRRPVEEWARLIVPVGSDVKISLNGATAETDQSVMLGVRFSAVIENVRRFLKVRDAVRRESGHYCRVTLQTTFLQSNITELPSMVRLAAELGVDRLKGHHLWAHFPQIAALSMRRDATAVARWNEVVDSCEAAADRFRRDDGSSVVLEGIFRLDPHGTEIGRDAQCPFLGQEAWIAWDGRFNPCCAPDAARRTLGEFGNLQDSGLMEIWRSHVYRELADSHLNRSVCKSCNMRRPAKSATRVAEQSA